MAESTRAQHLEEFKWEPGKSGNPAGRPKGTRNKLGEAFLEAFMADFEKGGIDAIERVRIERPQDYLKALVMILPKELKVTSESDLTNDQLIERIRQLDSVIRPFLGIEGESSVSVGTAEPPRAH